MTGDAFVTGPVGGAGRAVQAGARTPLVDQDFDSGTLYALRAAVQAHAGQAGLSEVRTAEVVLAVHELAANAIAHGAGRGHFRMWDLAGALSCEVVDDGPPGTTGSSSAAGSSSAVGSSSSSSSSSSAAAGSSSAAGFSSSSSSSSSAGFSSSSAGFSSSAAGSGAVADPWPAADGHGLWLVRQVADQLELRSGPRGTRAVVTFALPLPEDH